MSFHNSLGRRKISSGFDTWNPFSLIARFWAVIGRIKAGGIDGNLKGEGNVLGGVIVIQPSKGIIYSFQEKVGAPFPYDEIADAVLGASSIESKISNAGAEAYVRGEKEKDGGSATCEKKEECS